MADPEARRLFPLAVLALAGLVAGCASNKGQLRESDLMQLEQWLPGHYDNSAQVADDRRAGRTPHETRTLTIVPVDSLLLGKHAFYAQETASDDPQHITGQRLMVFELSGEHILQSVFTLTDPRRWRAADTSPELFTGLQPPDIKLMRGCGLVWSKGTGRFTAENDKDLCRESAPGGGNPVQTESRAELSPDELAVSDRGFDSHGKLVYGRDDEPFTRFVRTQ
jgi:hypothetical protein